MNPLLNNSRFWLIAFGIIVVAGLLVLGMQLFRPSAPAIDPQVTQAHLTVAARLTEAVWTAEAGSLSPSPEAIPTQDTSLAISTTASPTLKPTERGSDSGFLPTVSPTTTPVCDHAAAGNPIDITVPDDTEFLPGQSFTKIWRLQNIGSCTWTRDYAAQFFYGDRMGAPDLFFLGREVAPGQEVEIAVDLVAPTDPGSYQSNWKLSNADGFLFGIGPKGDAPFWVRIEVIRIATPTFTSTFTPTPTTTETPVLTATPTTTSTPPVEISTDLSLQVDQSVNLDNGQVNPASGADLGYHKDGDFHMLVPQTGTAVGVFGAFQPGLAACQAAGMSPVPIALESLSQGTYLCFRSGENRFGWLRYDQLETESGDAVFALLTWANP
jgi:hypothetical protein